MEGGLSTMPQMYPSGKRTTGGCAESEWPDGSQISSATAPALRYYDPRAVHGLRLLQL